MYNATIQTNAYLFVLYFLSDAYIFGAATGVSKPAIRILTFIFFEYILNEFSAKLIKAQIIYSLR